MLASASLFAQSATTTANPTSCSSFYAVGASFNSATSPRAGMVYAVGTPLTKCGKVFQPYWFTITGVTPTLVDGQVKVATSAATGFAYPIKQIGKVDLFAFMDAGIVQGAAAKLAVPYGGLAAVHVGKSFVLTPSWERLGGKNTFWLGLGRQF